MIYASLIITFFGFVGLYGMFYRRADRLRAEHLDRVDHLDAVPTNLTPPLNGSIGTILGRRKTHQGRRLHLHPRIAAPQPPQPAHRHTTSAGTRLPDHRPADRRDHKGVA